MQRDPRNTINAARYKPIVDRITQIMRHEDFCDASIELLAQDREQNINYVYMYESYRQPFPDTRLCFQQKWDGLLKFIITVKRRKNILYSKTCFEHFAFYCADRKTQKTKKTAPLNILEENTIKLTRT